MSGSFIHFLLGGPQVLSDCTLQKLELKFNVDIKEEIRQKIKKRYNDVVTPYNLLAYLLDHSYHLFNSTDDGNTDSYNWSARPELALDEEDGVRSVIFGMNSTKLPSVLAPMRHGTPVSNL